MSDITSLDHVESTRPANLSNQNDELVNYLDAYLYSSFFGAASRFGKRLEEYNNE